MQFELEPDNRGVSDDVLLDDLRRVAALLGGSSVSRDEYEKLGRFHPKTLVNRFGGWNACADKAGLLVRKIHVVSEAEMLADLRRVASEVGGSTLSVSQYTERGQYSVRPIARLFGGWEAALALIGLRPGPSYYRALTEQELFENLANVWRTVGRQPKQSDMRKPLSIVGHEAYNRRFGNWRSALEQFVAYMNQGNTPTEQRNALSLPESGQGAAARERSNVSTVRTAGWRLRFLVMRRDRFRCCQCGASPSANAATTLVVDHIVPWSQGGPTVLDNLQTLCEPCNGGKSALPASE